MVPGSISVLLKSCSSVIKGFVDMVLDNVGSRDCVKCGVWVETGNISVIRILR